MEAACGFVGLSVASAYSLRTRAGGEGFALGWRAALLIARDRLADILMSRAIDGHTDTYTRADGQTITRHRHDNRLALAMLTRLDKLAEHPAPDEFHPCDVTNPIVGARAAAADFPHYLALVESDAEAADVAEFIQLSETRRNPQLPQFKTMKSELSEEDSEGEDEDEEEDDVGDRFIDAYDVAIERLGGPQPVWLDRSSDEWRTSLPPAPDCYRLGVGLPGEPGYWRPLSRRELDMITYGGFVEGIRRVIRASGDAQTEV